MLHQPWFVALILAGAVERLSGVALGVAMEHDWFVQRLLQIAGASLFGIRLSKYGPVTCLKFAAGLMALVITIYDNPHMTVKHALCWGSARGAKLHWTMCNYECYSYICVCNPDQATWHFKGRRAWIDISSFTSHIAVAILQTGIPSSKANLIGTTEVAVASLAESTMLGVAIIANDVSHFRYLAMLSLLSVVGSAFMYCRWMYNPTQEQRTLFSFDPLF
ncbi:hypothetical protein G4B88_011176 [Cannabis sativa]|uniref:Solute carrier family 40 member n=1 Tax=Cannabis sativa TaxID=3483 RepID=A0A7J6E6F0_CANSA|nr:hypothetical protein G4B88_011176 [Cannabis sativa]